MGEQVNEVEQVKKTAKVIRVVQNLIIVSTAILSSVWIALVGIVDTSKTVVGSIKVILISLFAAAWLGMIPCGVAYMLCCSFHMVYLDKKYAKKSTWKPKGAGVPIRLTSYPPEIQEEVDNAFSNSFKICYGIIFGAVIMAFFRGLFL